MTNEEWKAETHKRAGYVAKYFKPKENLVIQDFIETASDISKELADLKSQEGKK